MHVHTHTHARARIHTHSHLHSQGEPAEGEEEPAEDEEGEGAVPKEVFTEQYRLSHTVACIDHDVSVVPRGAFIVDAAHKVTQNKFFEGLRCACVACA